MAEYSRVTRGGWVQGDDASDESRVTRGGWIDVAGTGGGTTVSVPAGSLTLTGNAPTVLTPRTIAVPSGSLTLTGFAPVVATPRTISVPAGSLVLTGFAPTVTGGSGLTIAVPAGALTLTGFAPTVGTTGIVLVPAGALTLTGYAPTVTAGGDAVVEVPSGTLTLTGFAPTVVAPQTVNVPAAALTLTGYAPRVSNGSPVLGPRLDEYPRLPSDSGQLALKMTDLMARTNTRVNELSQGYLWANFNAATAQPSASDGSWGDTVKNGRPRELGTPGSMYVVIGWVRLETDWAPMRVLTGN